MLTVLNVEHNRLVRSERNRILTEAGFRVLNSPNGADAIAACETEHPDVVLLDIDLPDINGLEVRRRLHGNPRTSRVPVIHVTRSMNLEDKWQALIDGAEDVLIEPIDPNNLVRLLSVVGARFT